MKISAVMHYNNLEEMLNYFVTLLPEPKPGSIASVSKYARVGDQEVKLQAIKKRVCSDFIWNIEVTIGVPI